MRDLPALPAVLVALARDKERHVRVAATPIACRRSASPLARLDGYFIKHAIPPENNDSDIAVYKAAVFVKKAGLVLTEQEFVATVLRKRPEFHEQWVRSKWRSARREAMTVTLRSQQTDTA